MMMTAIIIAYLFAERSRLSAFLPPWIHKRKTAQPLLPA